MQRKREIWTNQRNNINLLTDPKKTTDFGFPTRRHKTVLNMLKELKKNTEH